MPESQPPEVQYGQHIVGLSGETTCCFISFRRREEFGPWAEQPSHLPCQEFDRLVKEHEIAVQGSDKYNQGRQKYEDACRTAHLGEPVAGNVTYTVGFCPVSFSVPLARFREEVERGVFLLSDEDEKRLAFWETKPPQPFARETPRPSLGMLETLVVEGDEHTQWGQN